MRVKFWGTRGSIPTPGPDTVIHGGNTSCVGINLGAPGRLILDAGSGIRKLGLSIAGEAKTDATLLLTHVHWDHIQGFPFFIPAYKDSTNLDIFGLEVAHRKIERLLSDQMEQVYFPVDLKSLRANMRFHDFDIDGFECRGAKVSLVRANHTTETVAFKIEHDGRSVVFMPDNELAHCGLKEKTPYDDFVRFCSGVDLLIHDAQYTNATYHKFKGWGHSTFEEALNLGIDAGVKRLALFHHDPLSTDAELDRRLAWCKEHVRERGASIEVESAKEEVEHDLSATPAPAATK
jgi:phosphoribosyl 1,2-cyclic phosphodiesterase